MAIWRQIRVTVRNLFRRDSVERDLDIEIRSYSALLEEENMAKGMKPNEARRAARIESGGPEQLRQEIRTARAGAWAESLWNDCRYALRQLRRSPGFAAVAILTLALGIGTNTAIFSVVKAVLLDQLPFRQPDRLVKLAAGGRKELSPSTVSYLLVQDWKERVHTFQSIAVYGNWVPTLSNEGRPRVLRGTRVTYDFFDTLGVNVEFGRGFEQSDDRPDRRQVVLLSNGFWKEQFGGRLDALGKTITLSQLSFQIIGILPESFDSRILSFTTDPVQIYSPLAYTAANPAACRSCRGLRGIGRLKERVSVSSAQAEMNSIMPGLVTEFSDSYPSGFHAALTPLDLAIVSKIRQALWTLLGATGFVLLLACVNTSSLLLSRGSARRRELAVRSALGCSPGRLFRQLLTETMILTLLGGALGLLFSRWGLSLLVHWAPKDTPRLGNIHVDATVLLYALAASVLTCFLAGLIPALKGVRAIGRKELQETRRSSLGGNSYRTRQILIVGEVCLAFALILGTNLLLKSLQNVLGVNPGFQTGNLFGTTIALSGPTYAQPGRVVEFERQFLGRAAGIAGAESVAIVDTVPLSGAHNRMAFHIQDKPQPSESAAPLVDSYFVSAGYFPTMEIALRRGRLFNEADMASTSAPVAIIGEMTAREMWPGDEALGKHIQLGARNDTGPWPTIVGIVADIHQYGLDSEATADAYLPYILNPPAFPTVIVRSRVAPNALERAVEEVVAGIDKSAPVFAPATMDDLIAESVAQRRFLATLVACFGTLALILASIGIYGVMAYQVSQRTNEIGLRMALGASPASILRLVFTEAMSSVLLGICTGASVAMAFIPVLAGQLYKVKSYDPWVIASVVLILISCALLAAWIPARRASSVHPMQALRIE